MLKLDSQVTKGLIDAMIRDDLGGYAEKADPVEMLMTQLERLDDEEAMCLIGSLVVAYQETGMLFHFEPHQLRRSMITFLKGLILLANAYQRSSELSNNT